MVGSTGHHFEVEAPLDDQWVPSSPVRVLACQRVHLYSKQFIHAQLMKAYIRLKLYILLLIEKHSNEPLQH